MLDHISQSMSKIKKNRLFESARVVFAMQQYLDGVFGKEALSVKNYRSGRLVVMTTRYLIDEYKRKPEIVAELKKITGRERVSVEWKAK